MEYLDKKQKLEKLKKEYGEVMEEYHYTDAYNTSERCRNRLQKLQYEINTLDIEIKEFEKGEANANPKN